MKKKKENYSFDILEDLNTVASVTECTGLIQIPPTNPEESEAYSDIYVIPNQVNNIKGIGSENKNGVVIEKQKIKA